ncbi:peptide ABC transporter substrate-binding protein [Peribacillus frigoritolerans]|uniref:peptide ABC transporter substrate-binding protein n=1 Tax=Peribacillus frigoritolerans TaxID=450367 RepID=UPI002227006E|nr:peptide ABC transporter substrate-binding protein [Peribacillus frigoritolerans]UYY98723.1 peptide ABC transporter substrate-binding protein [Peribacillus frigoritolerans]
METSLLTERQQNVLWKKERIIELANEGLTRKQIHKQLNLELIEKGQKQVGGQYIYKYTNLLGIEFKGRNAVIKN